MTVGELRAKLEGVREEIPVVGIGHFGEGVTVDAGDCGVRESVKVVQYGWCRAGDLWDEVFAIPVADIGEEPD